MELSDIGERVYAAESLLNRRIRRGKAEYLVKWKGWSIKYSTWEPVDNIIDKRLLESYDKRRKELEGTTGPKRRGRKRRKTKVEAPIPDVVPRPEPVDVKEERDDSDSSDSTIGGESPSLLPSTSTKPPGTMPARTASIVGQVKRKLAQDSSSSSSSSSSDDDDDVGPPVLRKEAPIKRLCGGFKAKSIPKVKRKTSTSSSVIAPNPAKQASPAIMPSAVVKSGKKIGKKKLKSKKKLLLKTKTKNPSPIVRVRIMRKTKKDGTIIRTKRVEHEDGTVTVIRLKPKDKKVKLKSKSKHNVASKQHGTSTPKIKKKKKKIKTENGGAPKKVKVSKKKVKVKTKTKVKVKKQKPVTPPPPPHSLSRHSSTTSSSSTSSSSSSSSPSPLPPSSPHHSAHHTSSLVERPVKAEVVAEVVPATKHVAVKEPEPQKLGPIKIVIRSNSRSSEVDEKSPRRDRSPMGSHGHTMECSLISPTPDVPMPSIAEDAESKSSTVTATDRVEKSSDSSKSSSRHASPPHKVAKLVDDSSSHSKKDSPAASAVEKAENKTDHSVSSNSHKVDSTIAKPCNIKNVEKTASAIPNTSTTTSQGKGNSDPTPSTIKHDVKMTPKKESTKTSNGIVEQIKLPNRPLVTRAVPRTVGTKTTTKTVEARTPPTHCESKTNPVKTKSITDGVPAADTLKTKQDMKSVAPAKESNTSNNGTVTHIEPNNNVMKVHEKRPQTVKEAMTFHESSARPKSVDSVTRPKAVDSQTRAKPVESSARPKPAEPITQPKSSDQSTIARPVECTRVKPVESGTRIKPIESTRLKPVESSTRQKPAESGTRVKPVESSTRCKPPESGGRPRSVEPNPRPKSVEPNARSKPVESSAPPKPVEPSKRPMPFPPNARPKPFQPHSHPKPAPLTSNAIAKMDKVKPPSYVSHALRVPMPKTSLHVNTQRTALFADAPLDLSLKSPSAAAIKRELWRPQPEKFEKILVTDVKMRDFTITIRESDTAEGFFDSK